MNIHGGRWLTIVLMGSVVLNLLFLGGILGRVLTDRTTPGTLPPNMGWVMRSLPEEERKTVAPMLREHMESAFKSRRAMAVAQREVNNLLTEDELDTESLGQAFATLREASITSQEEMHSALTRVMMQLKPEQRQDVMNFISAGWQGEMRRRAGERRKGRPGRGYRQRPPPPGEAPMTEPPPEPSPGP